MRHKLDGKQDGSERRYQRLAWKTAFLGLLDNERGTYLAGALHRKGLTQRQLAEQCGIPQQHISEMENGKRTIGKENAKNRAAVLNDDYRAFL